MIAVILSLIISAILAGVTWLVVGSRIRLKDSEQANDAANFGAYFAAFLLPVVVFVFYVIELL
ncbi:MAG: hypothetical protein NXH85_06310 [Pseudomonadaceae bacterium]|nr:hypothetical protein [Pseudomonadaceae bacterium]